VSTGTRLKAWTEMFSTFLRAWRR